MIIDTHPHLIADDLDRYPAEPVGGVQSEWSKGIHLTGEELLEHMRKANVAKAVLVQASTFHGYDNSYTADTAARYPERFVGVACVDPLAKTAASTLTYWIEERGMQGARLFMSGSTIAQENSLDSSRLDPFWHRARELGIPVNVQITASAYPALHTVLARFPELRIILDHLGGPPIEDGPPYADAARFFDLASHDNLFLKFSNMNLAEASRGKATPESFFERIIAAYSPQRIMWGSNFPNTTRRSASPYTEILNEAQTILSFLPLEDQDCLFGGTALAMYPALGAVP